MNPHPIITCAVTGAGDTAGKHPDLPKSPDQIAAAAIDAAKAGAAIADLHVREPGSGKPSRDVNLYREVVERIRERESDTDVVLNLTTGMGGDLFLGPDNDPINFTDDTDCVGQTERMEHVEALLPEICSLDCGSLLLGGNVRVGLEDNLYLEKGVLASNAQIAERARVIVEAMGARVQTAAEARITLGLKAP